MFPWLLLILAVVFAALAVDARSLATPPGSVPYSLTATALGQDVSHMPLAEQQKLKEWNRVYGLGDLNQSCRVFVVLALGCGIASVLAFLN